MITRKAAPSAHDNVLLEYVQLFQPQQEGEPHQ